MSKIVVSEDRITTPIFRLAFPAVFEPKPNFKGALKYSIVALFSKALWDTELVPLRNLVKELIVKKWGTDLPEKFYIPFLDGDEKTYEGFENTRYFNAASDYKRPVVDGGNKVKEIKPQEIIDPSEVYAGMYCKASVNAYAWEAFHPVSHALLNSGVSIGFLALQKVKDGKPFSKFADAAEDFEPITPELIDANKEELFNVEAPATTKAKEDLMSQL